MNIDFDEIKEAMELWYNHFRPEEQKFMTKMAAFVGAQSDENNNFELTINVADLENSTGKTFVYINDSKSFLDKVKELTKPKSKFNTGDDVYYVDGNQCCKGKITMIIQLGDIFTYSVISRNNRLCDFPGKDLFKDKESAINSAINYLERQKTEPCIGETIIFQ